MALPLIAAGIAARAVAKKLATRAAGGITGAGAKQVNPVYRNIGEPKSAVTKIPKVTENQKNVVNKMRDTSAKNAKSGETARRLGSEREQANIDAILSRKTGLPKVVKVNSNPMRGK